VWAERIGLGLQTSIEVQVVGIEAQMSTGVQAQTEAQMSTEVLLH